MEKSNPDNLDTPRKIIITGISNRNKIQKITNKSYDKELKQRVESKKWSFSSENYKYENQIAMINDISNNKINDVSKIAIQQINQKISGYKHQDTIKKLLNQKEFITFESVINKMIECELKCRYCKKEILVLYDISREMTQWTVDRINNDLGHNIDNFHLACLECNLKRRRRTDEKFLFTKQLNIIKHDN